MRFFPYGLSINPHHQPRSKKSYRHAQNRPHQNISRIVHPQINPAVSHNCRPCKKRDGKRPTFRRDDAIKKYRHSENIAGVPRRETVKSAAITVDGVDKRRYVGIVRRAKPLHGAFDDIDGLVGQDHRKNHKKYRQPDFIAVLLVQKPYHDQIERQITPRIGAAPKKSVEIGVVQPVEKIKYRFVNLL